MAALHNIITKLLPWHGREYFWEKAQTEAERTSETARRASLFRRLRPNLLQHSLLMITSSLYAVLDENGILPADTGPRPGHSGRPSSGKRLAAVCCSSVLLQDCGDTYTFFGAQNKSTGSGIIPTTAPTLAPVVPLKPGQ
jgi:hypothetical protein